MNSGEAIERITDPRNWVNVTVEHGHPDDMLSEGGAIFSPCALYRYIWWNIWDPALPFWSFGMLNPSRASHLILDPTVSRCIKRAKDGGAGGLLVWNLFAYRATDPADMKKADDPVGTENAAAILAACEVSDMVIAGWGAHGVHNGRERTIRNLLFDFDVRLHALAFTKDGLPRHPLYLADSLKPQPWEYWA